MPSFFLRSKVTPFVILFVERSGSTYLATLLDAHEDILAKREELAHILQRGGKSAEQLEWARRFLSPPLIGRHAALGFKTKMVDILDPVGFQQLLNERHCKIIQLHRRNLVKAAISTMNAKRLHDSSGNWNLLKETDRLDAFSVDINKFEHLLSERLNWDREIEEFVKRLSLPVLKLFYEDMLLDETAFMRTIFDFISVRYLPVKGKTIKNTSDDLRRAISNFEELRSRFSGTEYESMFDEVLI